MPDQTEGSAESQKPEGGAGSPDHHPQPEDPIAEPVQSVGLIKQRGPVYKQWWFSLTIGIAVSVACLYVSLKDVRFGDVVTAFRKADYRTLPLMWGMLGLFYYLKAIRWGLILRPMGAYATSQTFPPIMIGFAFNNILPAHLGEFVRVFVFARNEKIRATSVLSTVVLERIFDVLAILVFFFIGLSAVGGGITQPAAVVETQTSSLSEDARDVTASPTASAAATARPSTSEDVNVYVRKSALTAAVFAALLVLGAVIYLIWTEPFVRIVEAILAKVPLIPEGVRRKVCHMMEAGAEGLAALRHGVLLLHISWNSLVQWGINGVMMYVALRAFNIDVSFLAACLLLGAVAFGVTIPSSPGYFGVINMIFGAVINQATFGVTDDAGVQAAAFYYHMGMYIPVTLIGLWYFNRTGLRLSEVQQGTIPDAPAPSSAS